MIARSAPPSAPRAMLPALLAVAGTLALTSPAVAAEKKACRASGESARVIVVYEQEGVRYAESMTLRLTYPADQVTFADAAAGTDLTARLLGMPEGTFAGAAVREDGLRMVLSRAHGFRPGDLVTVRFDRCAGAVLPPATAFRCTVEGAGSMNGTVPGAGCSVRTVE